MKKIDINGLISDIKAEGGQSKKEKMTKVASVVEAMKGASMSDTEKEARAAAEAIEREVGKNLDITTTLEKMAEEMEKAESVDDIVKIASEVGGSEFAYLNKIASAIADVVVADIEKRLNA